MSKIPTVHKILTALIALAAGLLPALLQVYTGQSHATVSTPSAVLAIVAVLIHGLTRPQPPAPPTRTNGLPGA